MKPVTLWRAAAVLLLAACVPACMSAADDGEAPVVSKVLGPLPTPRELADVHEKLAPPPRGNLPVKVTIDAETARRYERAYRHVSFCDAQLYGQYGSKTIPLGITGIHANEYVDRHELFVVEVEPDSPAAGRVRSGDIIIGANGRLHEGELDPRIPMGYALAEAQTEATAAKLSYMSNSVKSRYKWRYDRARALEANLTRGIAGLKTIARANK